MSVNEKMTAIADAIRGKTGGTDALTLDQMAAEISGISIGSDPVLEELYITENGTFTPDEGVDGFSKVTVEVESTGGGGENALDYANTLESSFYDSAVPSGTELKISFGSKAGTTMSSDALLYFMRGLTGAKSVKVDCGGEAPTTTNMNSFARCNAGEYELELIDFSGAEQLLKPTSIQRCLEWRGALKEVLGQFDMTNCTLIGSFADKAVALETITFKAGTIKVAMSLSFSPNLTDATIQNIIDGLADLTGGTAQTLTLHATVGAKLTDEQKAAASAKNWTISY